MRHDSKTLAVLTAPLHQQVAVLDISRHLACVSMPAMQMAARQRNREDGLASAKYLYSLAAIVCYLIFS
jgi:hypothetical protein